MLLENCVPSCGGSGGAASVRDVCAPAPACALSHGCVACVTGIAPACARGSAAGVAAAEQGTPLVHATMLLDDFESDVEEATRGASRPPGTYDPYSVSEVRVTQRRRPHFRVPPCGLGNLLARPPSLCRSHLSGTRFLSHSRARLRMRAGQPPCVPAIALPAPPQWRPLPLSLPGTSACARALSHTRW
jgi:hypothetical protein